MRWLGFIRAVTSPVGGCGGFYGYIIVIGARARLATRVDLFANLVERSKRRVVARLGLAHGEFELSHALLGVFALSLALGLGVKIW